MASVEVGSLHYDLDLKDDKLHAQLSSADKAVQNLGNSIGKHWDNAVKSSQKLLLGVTALTAGVIALGVKSVKAFEESQNGIAQTEAVLKSTGGVAGVTADQVTKLSKALQLTTKYSDEDVRSVENLLLTFTSIGKDIFPQATKTVLDMATALGEDTKSASIQLGKALQDPILGITALRRVGVNFSEDQKKVIQSLVETGHKAEAQKLILKELNTEFGGSAAAAANTYAGKLAQIKNQFNDVEEAIGKTILDAIAPLIGFLDELSFKIQDEGGLLKIMENFWHRNRTAIIGVAGAITGALVPAITALAVSLVRLVVPLIPFMVLGAALFILWDKNKLLFFVLAGAITGFAIGIGVILLPALIAATAGFASMAVAVIAATWPFILIGALIAGAAYLIVTHWDGVKKFFVGIFDWFKDSWPRLLAVLAGPLGLAATIVIRSWDIVRNFFMMLVRDITGFFSSAWQIITTVFDAIKNVAIDAVKAIIAFLMPGLDFLKNLFIVVFGGMLLIVLNTMLFIENVIIAVWNVIYAVVSSTLGLIWNVVSSVWNAVWNVITTIVGAIANRLISAFDFYRNIVVSAFSAIRDFISNVWNTIYGIISSIVNRIIGFFAPAFSWLLERGKDIVRGLATGISVMAGAVVSAISAVSAQIGRFFAGAGSWLYGVGRAVVQGLINGMTSMIGGVASAAANIANAVKNKVTDILHIKSPSRVFMEIGKNVTEGFAMGINNSRDIALDAMSGFANNVISPTLQLNPATATSNAPAPVTSPGGTVVNIGQINNDQDEAYVLRRLDRNQLLVNRGGSQL